MLSYKCGECALLGEIIVITNQKGGSGKTTTAVNLAACLALEGKRTLIVDLDPQGHATSGLGVEKHILEATVYDVFLGEVELGDAIVGSGVEGLDVAPSNINLSGVEMELSGEVGREAILKGLLEGVRKGYEYVVLDTSPSLGLLTLNALVACDSVIIPVQAEFYALEGVPQLLKVMDLIRERMGAPVVLRGVLITMFDVRTNLSKEVAAEVRSFFKEKVFETVIPRNVRLAEAPGFGKPAVLYSPRCKGSKAYVRFTREVMGLD